MCASCADLTQPAACFDLTVDLLYCPLQDLLFQQCFNSRLYRLSRAADPPFFMASVGDEGICRGVDAYVLTAVAKEGQTLRCGVQAWGCQAMH